MNRTEKESEEEARRKKYFYRFSEKFSSWKRSSGEFIICAQPRHCVAMKIIGGGRESNCIMCGEAEMRLINGFMADLDNVRDWIIFDLNRADELIDFYSWRFEMVRK